MLGCQHVCKQGKGTQPVLMLQTAAKCLLQELVHRGLISTLGVLKWLSSQLSNPCTHYIALYIYTHKHIHTYVSVSGIQGSSQIHYVAKDALELLILLPPLPNRWSYRCVPYWIMYCWGLRRGLLACLAGSLHPEPLPGYCRPSKRFHPKAIMKIFLFFKLYKIH